jgi:hypothetical protein
MKVLTGDKDPSKTITPQQQAKIFNKTSLGAISEAESVM